jgi:hypothetical protein
VAIAEAKRGEYEGDASVFWRKAPASSPKQEPYVQSLRVSPASRALVAQAGDRVTGCLIGALPTPPPVYTPGGPVCLGDDFAVASPEAWRAVEGALCAAVPWEAQARGAVLVVGVCAQRDQAKRALRQATGWTVASEW